MPDKPPFKNGLTAFQVALSLRDMVRVVRCVRRRTARRSQRRVLFLSPHADYRPNRRQEIREIGLAPRDFRLQASWLRCVEEKS